MIQAGSRSLPEGRRGVRWAARAIGFALLGIAAVAGATVGLEAQGRQPLTGRVVRVMDGDTIAVRVDKRVFTVRYIGTNTRDARMPGDSVDAGPTEAAEFNRALVLGQTVRLEMDAQEKDAQGRLLAYVYVGDLMVNAELVANGYAEVAIKPPNVMHEEMLQHSGWLRPKPHTPPVPDELPRRTVELEPGEAIERHPNTLAGERGGMPRPLLRMPGGTSEVLRVRRGIPQVSASIQGVSRFNSRNQLSTRLVRVNGTAPAVRRSHTN